MRRRGRRDDNQAAIVEALRGVGATVEPMLASLGKGCPDLLVGFRGQNYLMEVKNGDNAMLTQDEWRWYSGWQGCVVVVRTVAEALDAIRMWK